MNTVPAHLPFSPCGNVHAADIQAPMSFPRRRRRRTQLNNRKYGQRRLSTTTLSLERLEERQLLSADLSYQVSADPTPLNVTPEWVVASSYTSEAVAPSSATTEVHTLWTDNTRPSIASVNEPQALEVGVRFTPSTSGYISGVRFYKGPGNVGTHIGNLWTSSGQLLATATFTNETASGWQEVEFDTPVPVAAGQTYVASYFAPNGDFSVKRGYFSSPYASGPLNVAVGGGVFRYGNSSAFPSQSYANSNYWVDVVMVATPPVDATAPTVTSITPANGATDVATTSTPRITFSETMNVATITNTNLRLLDGGVSVAASVSYNPTTRSATLTPAAPLDDETTYVLSVSGVTDLAGNRLARAFTSNFTTVASPPSSATTEVHTLWTDNTRPSIASVNEPQALEVGVRFTPSTSGYISGVRFYKGPGNVGTHIGNLWTSSGQLLATATFTNETASGWQEVEFDTPVPVAAGQTYVASYFAPNGDFSVNRGYFSSPYASGPLNVAVGGGVFRYGNSSAFPSQSYANSNYWVDVVMVATPPVDADAFFESTPSRASTLDPQGIYPQGQQIAFGLYAVQGLNDFDSTKTNMQRVMEEGFTMAGPYYHRDWQGLEFVHQAAEHNLKFTYQLRPHPSLDGLPLSSRRDAIATLSDADIAAVVREQVEAVIDDPVANATVARWAITPEEIRHWVDQDLRYLEIAVDTLRQVETERGVAPRPVWNYQSGIRTAEQLIITNARLDVVAKGTYLTTLHDRGPQRSGRAIWSYDQVVEAAMHLDATPQNIFQLFEDFTDPLTGTNATEIRRVIRNDVYLALVRGIESLNVFSMFENRPSLTTHNEQFEAYGSVARDLTGELGLQEAFLFGERKDDLDIRPTNFDDTFTYTHTDGSTFEYNTLQAANIALGTNRYVVLVNTTESTMNVAIEGLPADYEVVDLFANLSGTSTGATYSTSLPALGVKVLKFSRAE